MRCLHAYLESVSLPGRNDTYPETKVGTGLILASDHAESSLIHLEKLTALASLSHERPFPLTMGHSRR